MLFLAACGGGGPGKLAVDSPALPYQAPDISEITGIDEDAEPADEAEEKPTVAAPAPAKVPAKAPAKTPAKVAAPKAAAPTPAAGSAAAPKP
jgi:hypothetical protein